MWYDYKCTNSSCNWTGELQKPVFAPELTLCPHCHNETLTRNYSPLHICLYGPDWSHGKSHQWKRDH